MFVLRDGRLHCEDVDLLELAERVGTPTYVYSRRALEQAWLAFDRSLAKVPHLVCYAVKANSNLAVLDVLARLGSGFDIVSVGELERVLAAGGDPARVVFSGVGKRADEMRRALEVGIRCFNVESRSELGRLRRVAAAVGTRAPVSLRVNPDVDAKTHPYIATGLKRNKFGIPIEEGLALYAEAAEDEWLELCGVDCHIGSQLTSLEPFLDALDRVLGLVDALAERGVAVRHVDVGGGLGIRYRDESPPSIESYAHALCRRLAGRELELLLEPGRAICAQAGALLTKVEYLKRNGERRFAVVDAAMNDFLRPALYDAWSEIVPLAAPPASASAPSPPPPIDVVGPVCETGDFLGWQREIDVAEGAYLAVMCAGAYGFAMSSNYNSRPRAAEVMVDGARAHVVRARETIADLLAHERVLPHDQ